MSSSARCRWSPVRTTGSMPTKTSTIPKGRCRSRTAASAGPGRGSTSKSVDPTGSTNHVVSGGLEYEGMSPVSNRAVQSGQQNRIRRSLSTSIGGVFDAAGLVENQDGMRLIGRDGTTVYLSFLQRVNKIDDVFYGLELHRNDGNANRVLCIGNGAEQCGYGVTSNVNVYGPQEFSVARRGEHRDELHRRENRVWRRQSRSRGGVSQSEVAGQRGGVARPTRSWSAILRLIASAWATSTARRCMKWMRFAWGRRSWP